MVKEEKVREVERVLDLINSHRTIGIIDLHRMPTRELKEIKRKLKDKTVVTVTKKTLFKIAIERSGKKNLEKLIDYFPAYMGLVFSNLDAFKTFKLVKEMKSATFAREGDVAEKDIEVKAGPTNLSPGPVIGELNKVGLPVGIEGGRIVVKKDTVLVKAGETISKEVASVLQKLGIPAKEIGLKVQALYEDGEVYPKDILELVGEPMVEEMRKAINRAINLSIAIEYPTKETVGFLFAKAYNIAKFIKERVGG